jgi:hypothetical protein
MLNLLDWINDNGWMRENTFKKEISLFEYENLSAFCWKLVSSVTELIQFTKWKDSNKIWN